MQTDLCTPFILAATKKMFQHERPIIALEGQSYAGKTTALTMLRQEGYGVIREYSEYKVFPSSDHFVQQPEVQAKNDFLFYLNIERQRYQDFLRLPGEYSMVFLDRSFFTLIAYRFATLHLSTCTSQDILMWAMETVLRDIFPLLYPDHVIYIHIPLALAKQRHADARDHLPSYFFDDLFYERFHAFFLAFSTLAPTHITIIDGTGSHRATRQKVFEVLQDKGLWAQQSTNTAKEA